MKHAKVSDLKAHLSEYLAGVRAGGSVTVYDRATPIALLVPIESESLGGFEVEAPSLPPGDSCRAKPTRLRRRVDVVRILGETRGDR